MGDTSIENNLHQNMCSNKGVPVADEVKKSKKEDYPINEKLGLLSCNGYEHVSDQDTVTGTSRSSTSVKSKIEDTDSTSFPDTFMNKYEKHITYSHNMYPKTPTPTNTNEYINPSNRLQHKSVTKQKCDVKNEPSHGMEKNISYLGSSTTSSTNTNNNGHRSATSASQSSSSSSSAQTNINLAGNGTDIPFPKTPRTEEATGRTNVRNNSKSNDFHQKRKLQARSRAVLDGTKLIVQLSPTDALSIETPSKVLFSTGKVAFEKTATNQVILTIEPSATQKMGSKKHGETANHTVKEDQTNGDLSHKCGLEYIKENTSLVVIDSCCSNQKFYPIPLSEYGTIYTRDDVNHVVLMPAKTNDNESALMTRSKLKCRGLCFRPNKFELSRVSKAIITSSDPRLSIGPKETTMTSVMKKVEGTLRQRGQVGNTFSENIRSNEIFETISSFTGMGQSEERFPLLEHSKNETSISSICNNSNSKKSTISCQEDNDNKGDNSQIENIEGNDNTKVSDIFGPRIKYMPRGSPSSECIFLRCDDSLVRYKLKSPEDRVELHAGKVIAWTLGVKFEFSSFCFFRTVVAVCGNPSGFVWIHNPRNKLYASSNAVSYR